MLFCKGCGSLIIPENVITDEKGNWFCSHECRIAYDIRIKKV